MQVEQDRVIEQLGQVVVDESNAYSFFYVWSAIPNYKRLLP
jgi:hypothetical protein